MNWEGVVILDGGITAKRGSAVSFSVSVYLSLPLLFFPLKSVPSNDNWPPIRHQSQRLIDDLNRWSMVNKLPYQLPDQIGTKFVVGFFCSYVI